MTGTSFQAAGQNGGILAAGLAMNILNFPVATTQESLWELNKSTRSQIIRGVLCLQFFKLLTL